MSQSVNNKSFRKTVLAGAVVAALGGALSEPADAVIYKFSFAGGDGNVFTMLQAAGGVTANTDVNNCNPDMLVNPTYCVRTAINGTITYDAVAGTGTMSIAPFSFFGSGIASASNVSFTAIGDGAGGAGNLMLGNMSFYWNANTGIPVSIVWDATGLLSAISGGLNPNDTITGGVLPASDNTLDGGISYPIGPAVMAVTTWNTTGILNGVDEAPPDSDLGLGTNPSGTLPLVTDTVVDITNGDTGVGGSPMPSAPFQGFNANFDFTNLLVTCVDTNCGEGVVTNTTPVNGSPVSATISVTFSRNMDATTVPGAIDLVDVTNGNTPVAITVTPNTGLATTFTISLVADQNPGTAGIDLAYSTQYQATVDSTAQDEDGNNLAASPNNTWTWTTQAAPQAQVCQSDVTGPTPLGSNFSMLEKLGKVFGGTNDIAYNFGNGTNNGHDAALLNTLVTGTPGANGTLGITTNTMASALPHPFFGAVWTAHHIRLFNQGTYSINTECTTTQLEAGTCAPNADPAKNITMTVNAGQIGAHMLFDWNGNFNIDVVNVWDQGVTWTDPNAGEKNNLWTGARWAGPSGYTVHPQTTWDYVSTDDDNDGIVGLKMIDGPFQGFSANFNLGPAFSCQETPPEPIAITDSSKVGGCSLGTGGGKGLTERGDWWLVAGYLAWLGLIRKRLARQQS